MCYIPNKINWKLDKIKALTINGLCSFFDFINHNILMIDNSYIEKKDIGIQVNSRVEFREIIIEQPKKEFDDWNILKFS